MSESTETTAPVQSTETPPASTETQSTETTTPAATETNTTPETETKSLVSEALESGEPKKDGETETEHVPFTADDFQLPEGYDIPDERKTAVVDFVNKYQLPPEAVKEFSELSGSWATEDTTKLAETMQQAAADKFNTMQTEWQEAVKSDPNIGGEKLAPALSDIADLIHTFTADAEGKPNKEAEVELRQAFDLTGAGNHPAMVKFLAKIADVTLVKEGGPEPGGDGNSVGHVGGLYPNLT